MQVTNLILKRVLQSHLPLASLVLIMWTPADSSSLSAAPLWPFILQAKTAELVNEVTALSQPKEGLFFL